MGDSERTKKLRARYITHPQRARHRLPVLAAWLRQVSEHVNGARFNLDRFIRFDGEKDDMPRSVREASACGFEGCALGWAFLCPQLRRVGLRRPVSAWTFTGAEGNRYALGEFSFSLDQACRIFGINIIAAGAIFGSSSEDWSNGRRRGDARFFINPHDPIAAAERVERFMADVGIDPLHHDPPPSQATT